MKKPRLTSIIRSVVALGGIAGVAMAQAQPVISNVYPDGTAQFQQTAKLTFVATAPAGVSNINLQLTGTKLAGGSVTKVYTSKSGLTLTSTNNGKIATAPLSSNMVYSAAITVTDSNNVATTTTVNFDTVRPVYTWEAEDYDYDNGKFIEDPQTNGYATLAAVDGVDAHNGSGGDSKYRPHDSSSGGLATEGCGDKPRTRYSESGKTDYDVGWNSGGNWANYTRRYPAGTWNIYVRAANPNGSNPSSAHLSGPGFDQIVSPNFGAPNTGSWQTYTWVPVNDGYGGLANFYSDGSAQTIRIDTTGGSYNANYYMLMPVEQGPKPQDAWISDFAPDGTVQFQATNKLAFTVNSTLGVKPADVMVQLTATTLDGKSSTSLLQSGTGLTITGPSTGLSVSAPVATNMIYTAIMQVTDANGTAMSQTNSFDTIIPSYTWEAEDWDYDGGLFVENWQPGAYSGLNGVDGADFSRPSAGGGSAYNRVGLATENASDIPRASFDGVTDYDIGNNGAGNWVNYTRDWPAGVYNMYIRVANGNGTTANAGALSVVTSGAGTADQTTITMGSYNSPGTGSWQKYNWQPIRDAGGNLARFTGGSKQTIRHTVVGGNCNQGFYMLMPADTNLHPVPFVTDIKPDGSSIVQYTNVLTFNVVSAAGISASGISVTVDGRKSSSINSVGTPNLLSVSCPIGVNALHTVVIVVTDAYGSSTNTSKFTTFDPAATIFFQAEDYDYEGGKFIDNPAPNAYRGLGAVADVDTHTVAGNFDGTHVPYRPAGLNQEGASDSLVPPDYKGVQNYDLGNTAGGNWGNYTRTYPEASYNVYMRVANGTGNNSPGGTVEIVNSGTTTLLGTFDQVPATGGWQSYTWVPLKDSNGKLAQFTGGSAVTLRITCGGGQNMDYYAAVPVDTSLPVVDSLYPNGAGLFQNTNSLGFVAVSSAGIDTNDIVVTLNGTKVSNLAFTGESTSWTVSCPLVPNQSYTATITVTTLNGGFFTRTFSFDTFAADNFTFEAEDYNYDSGKFIDNAAINAYRNLAAVDGVDAHNGSGGNADYRPHGTADGGLATEGCGDAKRPQYLSSGETDYDVGWNNPGNWANYTRSFPSGTFQVYMRGANPGASSTNSASAEGAFNGLFGVPGTGGWQAYTWVPLKDAAGQIVEFVSDGTPQTVKISVIGGSYNVNFYMLVPVAAKVQLAASVSEGNIVLSFNTQAGVSYQVEYTDDLAGTWSSLGTSVTGDGTAKTATDSLGAGPRFYRVKILE